MRARISLFPILGLIFSIPLSAAVILDDDFDDGDRTDSNLPEESAWFGSTVAGAPTLSATPGALRGNVLLVTETSTNTSSRLWITHFTQPAMPVELGLGDTLKITAVFVPQGVTPMPTTSRGLRLGLFNFSAPGAARVAADGFSTGSGGGAPGANVTGYMLNMNFAQTLGSSPLQLMRRTDLQTNNLMGALAVFTSLSSGGGPGGTPGFQSGVPYTLEFSIRNRGTSVDITARFSDTNGWVLTHAAGDAASPVLQFDTFALRPNSVVDSAEAFTFTRFKVEVIPHVFRITSVGFTGPERVTLTWNSLPQTEYEVQWRDDLPTQAGELWNFLGTRVANDLTTSIDDETATWITRFYRVVTVPAPPATPRR